MAIPGPKVPIAALRKAYGLTLAELADRIKAHGVEVTPDALSNVERGHKRASNHLLHAWCRALHHPPLDVEQGPQRLADAS